MSPSISLSSNGLYTFLGLVFLACLTVRRFRVSLTDSASFAAAFSCPYLSICLLIGTPTKSFCTTFRACGKVLSHSSRWGLSSDRSRRSFNSSRTERGRRAILPWRAFIMRRGFAVVSIFQFFGMAHSARHY